MLARIADSVTASMRNAVGSGSAVQGKALGVQTYVHARWVWSVAPVALVVSTFLFMASTILLSLRNGIPVWKSSSLAVLVHGLSHDTCDQIAATKLNAMESNAEGFSMVMTVGKPKWRLEGSLR